jgi:ATP-binding cassette subfamily F protein 3
MRSRAVGFIAAAGQSHPLSSVQQKPRQRWKALPLPSLCGLRLETYPDSMLLLSCSGLSRGFDAGPLFEDLGFELFHGERVGLVAPNGAGKTTLMRILAGLDQPDTGEVRLHAGARAALLRQTDEFPPEQTLFAEAKTALNDLLAAHDDLVHTAEKLSTAADETERKALAARFDRLTELLHNEDAYTIDHKVEQVLEGIGFRPADYDRPVVSFSGGQQRRLLLAKLLLSAPDVMLLDEPSNHLDIDATRWLEEYLVKQPQAMLIVSHDRYFLNRVVTKVFELHHQDIRSFPGNYDAYVRQRAERHEQELKAWEAQKDYVEKQEEYIRRVHYGQLAKQAQSRRKALDRLERVERPTVIETPRMHFGQVRRAGDVVIDADRVSKAYDAPLFTDLSFALPRGKRLGIMGPNGCGKTTLLRLILGDEQPDSGKLRRGHLTDFGYFDQHLRILPEDETLLRAIWPKPDPEQTEQRMRDLLARFGLSGEQVTQRVGDLSGGERSRGALAKLVAGGANVLVLDEPTNHLDIWACDALEAALKEFDGSAVVVSHDRYFLNQVADLLIVFEGPGKAQVVHGNYETYERLRAEQLAAASADRRTVPTKPVAAASAKPAKRKRKFPYRKVEELEADIATGEAEVARLEAALADGDLYRDHARFHETMTACEAAKTNLSRLYEHWEEAAELN